MLSFEEWHHASCREHSVTHLTTPAPVRFGARLSTRRLGRFVEGFERLDASDTIGVARDRRAIEKDREHPYVVFAVLAGEVSFEQDGRALRAAAGDMFLYDQGLPFMMALRQTRRLAIQVPRGSVGETIADPAGCVARLPDLRAAPTKLARSVLEHLAFAPEVGAVVQKLRQHVSVETVGRAPRPDASRPEISQASVSGGTPDPAPIRQWRRPRGGATGAIRTSQRARIR